MANIYFFSGSCGCGKTTLSKAFAKHLVNDSNVKQVYLIHGDDFHTGFVENDNEIFAADGQNSNLLWHDILKFNWECILNVAENVLNRGLDVVIDYVIEDELPLVQNLAEKYNANLYYVVLTASKTIIRQRIIERGDTDMIERAVFLKDKLDTMYENQGHLFDNTEMSVEEELEQLKIEDYKI